MAYPFRQLRSISKLPAIPVDLEKSKARKARREEKRAENKALMDSKQGSGAPPRRFKHKKRSSGSQIEKELWKAFSDYIRAKPHDWFPNKPKLWDNLCWYCQERPIECAGHVISRRRRAVKYDERNVFGSCLKCNWMDKFVPGFHDIVVTVYIERFGLPQWQEILELSRKTCPRSKPDMIAKTLEYRQKLANLKAAA